MNYAQDPHCPELISQISHWLDSPVVEENRQKWLLVDGAVLGEKIIKKVVRTLGVNRVYNIFAESELFVYAWRAPHLIRLDTGQFCRNELRTLLLAAAVLPAIAFLEGSADARKICGELLRLGQARTCDGLNLYCRFADTRITPVLMEVLDTDQRKVLIGGIRAWQIVGRHGTLQPIFVNDTTSAGATTDMDMCNLPETLVLSEEQYFRMMRAAEADEIFQMLCDGAPELVPVEGRGDFHALLAGFVASAHIRKIEQTSEVYQFSVVALSTRVDFFAHSALVAFWQKIAAKTNNFSDLVSEWTDETWDALCQAPHGHSGSASTTGANS